MGGSTEILQADWFALEETSYATERETYTVPNRSWNFVCSEHKQSDFRNNCLWLIDVEIQAAPAFGCRVASPTHDHSDLN